MGYSITSTVLSAAASIGLTDVASAKDELQLQSGNTAHDTWLAGAIARISSMMANYTNRTLVPELVQDVIDIDRDAYPAQTPGGFASIQLSRWPVLGLISVVQTLSPTQTQVLVEGTDFRLDAANGLLHKLNTFTGAGSSWDACPITAIYSAGYGNLINETEPVPATSPYTITVDKAATFSADHRLTFANGTALARVSGVPAAGQYRVAAGVYTFAAADAGKPINFAYTARDVPDDLADMCLRLIVGRFKARGRDPMLMQQDTPDVGSQRYWVGGIPGQDGPFTPEITASLDTYRVPVMA